MNEHSAEKEVALLVTTRRLSRRSATRIRTLAVQRRWLWLRVRYGIRRSVIPGIALTDIPEPLGNHCPGCGWSSGGHDPICPVPPKGTTDV